jgi:hypothetical protein
MKKKLIQIYRIFLIVITIITFIAAADYFFLADFEAKQNFIKIFGFSELSLAVVLLIVVLVGYVSLLIIDHFNDEKTEFDIIAKEIEKEIRFEIEQEEKNKEEINIK